MQWWFKHPQFMRRTFNLWPPFLFVGLKIDDIAQDYSYAKVKLKWRPWTRNINGSQFGGSMFAMTDPIYTTLLFGALGTQRYYIWDQSASIVFKKPAYGAVWFEARITAEMLADIRAKTASGEKYLPEFTGRIINSKGELIAEVKRILYIRLKPSYRPTAAVNP